MKKRSFSLAILFLSWIFLIIAHPALAVPAEASTSTIENKDAITLDDYCAFLNASDDASQAVEEMEDENWKIGTSPTTPSILRSGVVGNYRYEVIPGKENELMAFLSYNDLIEYCAWKNKNDTHSLSLQPLISSLSVDSDLKSNLLFFSCMRATAATQQTSSQWSSRDDSYLIAAGMIGFSLMAFYFYETATPLHNEAPIPEKAAEEETNDLQNKPENIELENSWAILAPLLKKHWEKNWEIVEELPRSPSHNQQLNEWGANEVAHPEGQKKKIELFKNFAARGESLLMSGYLTDSEGNMTHIEGEPPPETLGGTAAHIVLVSYKHKDYVNLFETALKEEYGLKVANELLTPKRRQEALMFGVSNNMVFDCLKEGVAYRVNQCIKNLDACSSENNNLSQEKKELLEHAQLLAALLKMTPNAPTAAESIRPTTATETISYLTVKSVDVTMTAQSTVAWTRRALWALQKLGFL